MIAMFYCMLAMGAIIGVVYGAASLYYRFKRQRWEASWNAVERDLEGCPVGEKVPEGRLCPPLPLPEGVEVEFESAGAPAAEPAPSMEELVKAYGELDTEALTAHIKAAKIAGGLRLKELKAATEYRPPASPHALPMPTPDEAEADLALRKSKEGQPLKTLEPELKAYMQMCVDGIRPAGMSDEEFFQQAVREARLAQAQREEEEDKALGTWVDLSTKYSPPPPNVHAHAMPSPNTLVEAHRPKENAYLGQKLMETKFIEATVAMQASANGQTASPHAVPMPPQAEIGDLGRPTANAEVSIAHMSKKIGRLIVDKEADTEEIRPWPKAAETRHARQKSKAKKGRAKRKR